MKTELPLNTEVMAEAMRQSHCDRKMQSHKCQGVMTIGHGVLKLDCILCGGDSRSLENASRLVQEAKDLCRVVGVDYDKLEWSKRNELLIAVLDLMSNGVL